MGVSVVVPAPRTRVFHAVGAALVASGLFHLVVQLVDGGPWEGPVGWRKPTTFGLSFGLTLISVVWVTSYVPMRPRLRWFLLGVFALDCVVEVGGITVQAWRHVPSHFNMSTPTNTGLSMMLAVGGAVLVVVLTAFAVAAFRGAAEQAPSMRLALRTGFASLLIGLGSGAGMIARGVVAERTGSQELAYQVGGFLKPVHGVSLHGVLVLPALAWLLGRLDLPESQRTRWVALAAAGYGLAILVALGLSLAKLG
jgi:hypothetical protein